MSDQVLSKRIARIAKTGCSCNPPCVLQAIHKATKAQLREWLLNEMSEREMAEAYYPTLQTHLRSKHRCRHDFASIANGDAA